MNGAAQEADSGAAASMSILQITEMEHSEMTRDELIEKMLNAYRAAGGGKDGTRAALDVVLAEVLRPVEFLQQYSAPREKKTSTELLEGIGAIFTKYAGGLEMMKEIVALLEKGGRK